MIDLTPLIAPLQGPQPSGPNLEYAPEFLELERAQLGRPEQIMGDTVKPGEAPNWTDVRDRAATLLERTRDLRVAVTLSRALLALEGFDGFAAGLRLLRGLLEAHWDTVHPQLDADDHNDPTARANSLAPLGAPAGLVQALRLTPLIESPSLGRFTLRDVLIAFDANRMPPNLANPAARTQVEAALLDAKIEKLESTAAAVATLTGDALAIDALLTARIATRAPNLGLLIGDLKTLDTTLMNALAARGSGASLSMTPAAGGARQAQRAPPPGADAAVVPGAVAGPDDVVRQIDLICDYYRRHEPSSPVPLLLKRAKRLVSQDFMTILRDLAPAGVSEAELIRGAEGTPS